MKAYIRATREAFRDSVVTGQEGRPKLRPWRNILIAQVIKRSEGRRVVEIERRVIDGTVARVETLRRRSQGDGMIRLISSASMRRVGTLGAACASKPRHNVHYIFAELVDLICKHQLG